MPIHTCYSYGFRPRLYSGLVCIGMYLVCNGMYWFVYYKHNTDQYWPNGTIHLGLYWFVFVCNGMYCVYLYVMVCMRLYWYILLCIDICWTQSFFIYWWSASKLHSSFRMPVIRRCLYTTNTIPTNTDQWNEFMCDQIRLYWYVCTCIVLYCCVLACIDPYALYLYWVYLLLYLMWGSNRQGP